MRMWAGVPTHPPTLGVASRETGILPRFAHIQSISSQLLLDSRSIFLSFPGRFSWNAVWTGDSLRETDILSWFGHIRFNLRQFSLVSWWIGFLAGWTAVRMDGVVGSVWGKGSSTQRESRVKGRYLSCSRFRCGIVILNSWEFWHCWSYLGMKGWTCQPDMLAMARSLTPLYSLKFSARHDKTLARSEGCVKPGVGDTLFVSCEHKMSCDVTPHSDSLEKKKTTTEEERRKRTTEGERREDILG